MSKMKTTALPKPSSRLARSALLPLHVVLMIVWSVLLVAGSVIQGLSFVVLLAAQRVPGASTGSIRA